MLHSRWCGHTILTGPDHTYQELLSCSSSCLRPTRTAPPLTVGRNPCVLPYLPRTPSLSKVVTLVLILCSLVDGGPRPTRPSQPSRHHCLQSRSYLLYVLTPPLLHRHCPRAVLLAIAGVPPGQHHAMPCAGYAPNPVSHPKLHPPLMPLATPPPALAPPALQPLAPCSPSPWW